MNSEGSICTSLFYGSGYKVNEKLVGVAKNRKDIEPYQIKDLVNGPPVTWKVFKKQADALNFISKYNHNLMAFAFESDNSRLFLVAHPEVFWHYDCQRPPSCRCSYEIIPENAVCKLYFDLEYNIPLNPTCNGPRMVHNFITAVIFFLQEQFKIDCDVSYIINLDATTDKKFSRHLIFNIPNVCFASNNQAGNFVNYVCSKILDKMESKSHLPENLSAENCSEMMVLDAKQRRTLFCDLSVYSRNRHFRLYKSTKYGKFAPLICSSGGSTVITDKDSDKGLFIDSLITYIPEDHEKLNVLCFKKDNTKCLRQLQNKGETHFDSLVINDIPASPYKDIDNFINELVFPGKIYRSFYFSTSKVINYDVIGNRFCGNIGRSHKRNNIKYVVDLKDGTYYQKCHDYECFGYKSEKNSLPKSLQLLDFLDSPSASSIGVFNVSENMSQSLERFPSCGLSDDEIINHLSNQPFQRFPSFDLSEEQINHLESSAIQRFPSFDLSDEELISHLSAENMDI
ncbi:DNA-directed primase/polymerase protein [Halyomorpha halys]|uniref:DNA-directed primase/polymerase protein n=1 Tax=Halyomorpha halys TaxID=286706 RepID=UPI0006D503A7|nr:DNA-directed primase/polymerase protein-like [Halyomorpha halys]